MSTTHCVRAWYHETFLQADSLFPICERLPLSTIMPNENRPSTRPSASRKRTRDEVDPSNEIPQNTKKQRKSSKKQQEISKFPWTYCLLYYTYSL